MSKKKIKKVDIVLLALATVSAFSFVSFFVSGINPKVSAKENEVVVSQNNSEEKTGNLIKDSEQKVPVYFFGRKDCSHCQAEEAFFKEYLITEPNVVLTYYDIVEDSNARELYESLVKANNLPKVTPYTFIGGEVVSGFGTKETTGKQIIDLIERAKNGNNYELEEYLTPENLIRNTKISGLSSSTKSSFDVGNLEFKAPFVGLVNAENFSRFSLSFVLGLIDGFNPCAMWVLMTFLLILMQVGNKKKMFYVAGLFIFAEAIMYYLILNVWYKTWDFVALDGIITPIIGAFTIACGFYFINKYRKTKDKLTCDVTSIEEQAAIQKKIKKLVTSPMTIATIVGIVGIALSVNVIEFACSIGIPQAFTKILEINALDFWTRQWYLFVYIFAYMIDDFVVFAFALYGFDKLQASEKYSKLSVLLGGIVMLILGFILLFSPDILIF